MKIPQLACSNGDTRIQHISNGDLAERINEAHAAAQAAARSAIEHAREAGEALLEAKGSVPHGQWLAWLAGNCPTLPPRTAQAYMRIAARWAELANTQRVAYLPIREALALLAEPSKPRHGDHEHQQHGDVEGADRGAALAEASTKGSTVDYIRSRKRADRPNRWLQTLAEDASATWIDTAPDDIDFTQIDPAIVPQVSATFRKAAQRMLAFARRLEREVRP